MGHDVAVPDIIAGPVEVHDDLQGFTRAHPNGVLQTGVFGAEILDTIEISAGV